MQNDKHQKDLEKILNPENVKRNLIKSGMFLTAFEMINYSIIERSKIWLCMTAGLNEKLEPNISQEYKDAILNRKISELGNKKNTFYSSCLWIYENGGISLNEVEQLQDIRRHRNKIAHELPTLMVDSDHEINIHLFNEIRRLLEKIDRWWLLEFEIPTNPDFDNFAEKDLQEFHSGYMIMMEHLIEIVKKEMKE